MALIVTEQVRAGMTLAAPVLDRRGRMLIPAGHELSERHVQALRTWAIAHVEVEGEPEVSSERVSVDPELAAAAERIVAERVARNDATHPLVAELFRFAVDAEAHALASGGAAP